MTADFEEVDENGNPVVRPPLTTEDKLRSAQEALKWCYQARDDDQKHYEHRIKDAVREGVLASAIICGLIGSLVGLHLGRSESAAQQSRLLLEANLPRACLKLLDEAKDRLNEEDSDRAESNQRD